MLHPSRRRRRHRRKHLRRKADGHLGLGLQDPVEDPQQAKADPQHLPPSRLGLHRCRRARRLRRAVPREGLPGPHADPGQPEQRKDQQGDEPLVEQYRLERRDHGRVVDIDAGIHSRHDAVCSFVPVPSPGCSSRTKAGRGLGPRPPAAGMPNRRNRTLLPTTKTDDAAIAAPAISGLRNPAAASGIAAMLYPNAQARLRRMVASVARASLIASGTVPRSSRSRIISAAQMATSVPEPMASPRSAAASAGPSLTPSPTMATDRPCACRSVITVTLSAGIAPAITSPMPASAATAAAVAWLSPVSRMIRRPRRRIAATAPAAEDLTVSATATAPHACPSHPASTTV